MAGFLSAHGYEPGPTQRPLLAGAIAGFLATVPAVAFLWTFGSLRVQARILGTSEVMTIAAGCLVMAAAGAVYSRLFGRAANDRRGGWLFGMAFGFVLWASGAVMVLPLACGGLAPAGPAAIGLFASLVAWGAATGALVPFVHRPLHEDIASGARHRSVGPSAAAGDERQSVTAAFSSSTRSSRSQGKKSPSDLRPKWP
jgi:hypothetical protein